jgi:deazaflavin-dependent oxidoreductase (nitroreductase family)
MLYAGSFAYAGHMGLLRAAARRFGGKPWFAAVSSRFAPPLDRVAFSLSRGRRAASEAVAPTLLLVHTGRRSGEQRRTPLFYVPANGGYAVVGSNYGKAAHPAWARNLVAKPHASVVIGGRTTVVRARLATEVERADLWPRFVALFPGYADYAARTHRPLPIFVLSPAS